MAIAPPDVLHGSSTQVASFVSTLHARLTLQQRRSELQHLGVAVTTLPAALARAYFAAAPPPFSLSHSIALVLPEAPAPWGFARVPLVLPGASSHDVPGGRPGCWCGRVQHWLVLDCTGKEGGRWLVACACDALGLPLRLLAVTRWQGDEDVQAALQRAQRAVPVRVLRRQLQVCMRGL